MKASTKERLLVSLNKIMPIADYDNDDCIFSQKYAIHPVTMVYILQQLAKDFRFTIDDDFVDALELCTFAQLEALLEKYGDSIAA